MNADSYNQRVISSATSIESDAKGAAPVGSPILLVPYMWIGDFVRSHSVVKVLQARWPERPVDFLTSSLCAPLLDYMPGVRKGIVCDLPRGRLPIRRYVALASRLRDEAYGTSLVMLRTWKAALAPFLAGIPVRTGFVGEARFVLINDLRWGERRLERMIDCMGALAMPKSAPLPTEWPLPELVVPPAEVTAWLARRGLAAELHPVVALAPGAVGRGKRWSTRNYAELAQQLAEAGNSVWVLGGPNEAPLAREIAAAGGPRVRDLTGTDLRDAIIALAAVDAAVTNDSGLMHVAAAIGTPTIALFGPTSPRLWAPLNPLAAAIEPARERQCPQCGQTDCANVRHRDVDEISVSRVLDAVKSTLTSKGVLR
jgi:heptosyltransferase-2